MPRDPAAVSGMRRSQGCHGPDPAGAHAAQHLESDGPVRRAALGCPLAGRSGASEVGDPCVVLERNGTACDDCGASGSLIRPPDALLVRSCTPRGAQAVQLAECRGPLVGLAPACPWGSGIGSPVSPVHRNRPSSRDPVPALPPDRSMAWDGLQSPCETDRTGWISRRSSSPRAI